MIIYSFQYKKNIISWLTNLFNIDVFYSAETWEKNEKFRLSSQKADITAGENKIENLPSPRKIYGELKCIIY